MARRQRRITPGYILILTASAMAAVAAGWTSLAGRMDRDAYDWMSRAQPPRPRDPQGVVLAFDEITLARTGGMRRIRTTLADVLEPVLRARPSVVAVDIILADAGDAQDDARLAQVLQRTPNLVLASDLVPTTGVWEDPLPLFRPAAKAIGHIHAAPDPVSRVLPLELVSGHDRRWAMALEAARLQTGAAITESPEELTLGSIEIPCSRSNWREMYIRYRENIPSISAAEVLNNPASAEKLRNKVVFAGITAQTAARDRLVTPLDRVMSGVEIHAETFETILGEDFIVPARLSTVIVIALLFTSAAGAIFAFLSGWPAYLTAAATVLAAHVTPHAAFSRGVLLPYLPVVWAAWLPAVSAAAWQYFVVRRQLQRSESDKQRYQRAIHFVTHEMRSPLTAIQGSSELMGRYNLADDKRRQMAQMINSESKRLAKMIQTFLDIERLSDDQTEIRSELFELADVLKSSIDRAQVFADRKGITIQSGKLDTSLVKGDQELMEYAVYNLLTNAVKYSPSGTEVSVSAQQDGGSVRVIVQDQGMGMDEKELRNIGRKFYRTKKAEASGETGTGIGLSLVHEIVAHHNGRMEVTSTPGAGSSFTLVLPAAARRDTLARKSVSS